MTFEALFVAAYAGALLAAAAGLHRLGRMNSSPWASRLLAGYRRHAPPSAVPRDDPPGWPHSDAGRLHTAMALVAGLAALLLAGAALVRHHRPLEAATLTLVLAAAVAMLTRLVAALRTAPRQPG
jgi:hypothetical protein